LAIIANTIARFIYKSKDMGKKAQAQQEEVQEEAQCTVFVSGIPYNTTDEKLKELFAPCGEVMLRI